MKKKKKLFYNTGFRFEICFYDRVKFKIRLNDFCDKKGIKYKYLIQFKFFKFEVIRTKFIDQQGKIYKRRVHFRS